MGRGVRHLEKEALFGGSSVKRGLLRSKRDLLDHLETEALFGWEHPVHGHRFVEN